jgi:hypothetical protein
LIISGFNQAHASVDCNSTGSTAVLTASWVVEPMLAGNSVRAIAQLRESSGFGCDQGVVEVVLTQLDPCFAADTAYILQPSDIIYRTIDLASTPLVYQDPRGFSPKSSSFSGIKRLNINVPNGRQRNALWLNNFPPYKIMLLYNVGGARTVLACSNETF